jgi:hypothetical protein
MGDFLDRFLYLLHYLRTDVSGTERVEHDGLISSGLIGQIHG